MPLTSEQREKVAQLRVLFNSSPLSLGTAESLDVRARRPDPAHIPLDGTAHVEIAPPSAHPHPLLDGSALKSSESVPIYTYALHHGEDTNSDTIVLFLIHGGGNVAGHPTHWPFINFYFEILRAIASRSGDGGKQCVVIAPCYRLATIPENTFPAALHDLIAAYDHVLTKGYKASNIFIAGDSAGGGHALVLTHLILQSDRAAPHGVISIAPIATQDCDSPSELAKENANTDVITVPIVKAVSDAYLGNSGVSLTDPLVSPAYIPFTPSWPKTLILVGSGDVLIDGSRELEKRLSAVHAPVELVEYEDHPHGWWTMPDGFGETIKDAAQRIARICY